MGANDKVLAALHPGLPYDREVLAHVVIYHHKVSIEGCLCGWSELGRSIGEHVADVYEDSVRIKYS